MNKRSLIIGLMLVSVVLTTNSVSSAQSSNEVIAIPLSDPSKRGKLKAHLNSGSITVKGTARKDVLIRYAASEDEDEHNADHRNENRDGDNEDSRDGLKRIGGGGMELEVTETDNTVAVKSNSWNHGIDLDIEIPSGMDIQLHTYNDGDLMITNVQGELSLSNFNGAITALNIGGSAVASTYNGDIKVTFDRVAENTPMSYSTFNGDIDLLFPSTLKASLKMKTEEGEILTGFDVKTSTTGPVQKKDTKAGVTRVIIDEWKYGDVNGGGSEITMKTYNGDILIRKK